MFFERAVDDGLIPSNPFEGVKAPAQKNPSRKFFVTREMTDKILDACPDAQWRLIIALCRYGCLRCPSEVFALKWGDIQWDQHRFLVRSKKTERYEGKDSRLVPLFD